MVWRRAIHLLWAAVTLTGACSLHSLEYLEGGAGSAAAGRQAVGTAGALTGSGARGGSGGTAASGGSGSQGGTDLVGAGGANDAGAPNLPPPVPSCTDLMATVDETDVDCGGRTCDPCLQGMRCLAGTDCQSGICTNQVCQPPTCTDLAVNGDETDLNCGGTCPQCAEAMRCNVGSDCVTGKCQDNICVSITCPANAVDGTCPLLVDGTPYSLSPGGALDNCIDDDQQSVDEGNPLLLYTCKLQLNQTFWAVAQADGYFALRSALSGKCLQVRAASMSGGAVIEQAACDLANAQLWKPSVLDANLMQLTSKLSGLALGVGGSNAAGQAAPVVQNKVNGGAGTGWRVLTRVTGAYVAFSIADNSAQQLRHSGSVVTLATEDDVSGHWKVVPGLDNIHGVSFQSRDEPGRYLRHASFRLWSDISDGSGQFRSDATFRYASPFTGQALDTHGLQSVNYKGHFLARNGTSVALASKANTPEYNAGATWRLSPR